jgi:protein-S-isoprenylcysteine O-methyltransferase Ste14
MTVKSSLELDESPTTTVSIDVSAPAREAPAHDDLPAAATTARADFESRPSIQTWRPRSPVMVSLGNFFFKYRDFLSPAVFIALVVLFRPRLPLGDARYRWITDVAGILICLAGLILRAAVVGFEYIKRGGKDKKVYADSLVVGGFFAHSRNPLYLGNFLGIVGFFVIHNNPWVYLIGLSFYTVLYLSIVAAEETFLHAKFGPEYEDYCRRVNRFIPSYRGLRDTVAGMAFDWRRVIRKEYGTIFLWYSVCLGLMFWGRCVYPGVDQSRGVLNALLILWSVGLVAWIASRILKKRGTLGVG